MDQQQERQEQERPVTREAARSDTSIGQAKQVIDMMEQKLSSAYRVPMKKDLYIVNAGELIDLIGQLRIALPKAVVQAQAVLEQSSDIVNKARAAADKTADEADRIYRETVAQVNKLKEEIHAEADKYSEQVRQKALADANAQIEDANTRAEQIIRAAQQQAQQMVSDSEITRRAQAYAMETRERAERDADSIYNQACVQVDKMLSGASVALSRSASERAGLRDNLLGRGNIAPNGQPNAQNMQGGQPLYEQR